MKTFSEFLEESYACLEERTQREIEAGMSAGIDKIKQEKRLPKLVRSAQKHLVRAGKKARSRDVVRAADRLAKMQTSPQKEAAKRREERKNPLTTKDFESHAKRNLINKPGEFATIATDREEHTIDRTYKKAKTAEKESGVKQHVDHSQPLSQERRKPENRGRFYAVTPGHSAKNLEVKPGSDNLQKKDIPPKKGEHGSNFTRAGAIRHTANDTKEFIKNLDSAIGNVQGKPAERMKKAYDRITGLSSDSPKKKR